MENNMMRKESILILPYNTLRLVDLMVQFEIDKANNNFLKEKLENLLRKLVIRSKKNLKYMNPSVDESLINELYKINFHTYYELAPRTELYQMIGVLANQSFISEIIVLFDNPNAKDDVFSYNYYDGTIESLEKYITENNVTCLVFDDMELLKNLSDRGNVSLDYKTFIVSKLGYNFERGENNILNLKYYDEIKKKYPHIELTVVDLYNF